MWNWCKVDHQHVQSSHRITTRIPTLSFLTGRTLFLPTVSKHLRQQCEQQNKLYSENHLHMISVGKCIHRNILLSMDRCLIVRIVVHQMVYNMLHNSGLAATDCRKTIPPKTAYRAKFGSSITTV